MKMRLRPAAALLAIVLVVDLALVCVAAAQPVEVPAAVSPDATPVPDTWHATTYVAGSMGLRVIRYWSKGDWMRAETLIRGHPITTIVRGKDYVAFDGLTGRGARIRRSPAAIEEDTVRDRPFGNDLAELVAQGAVKIEDSTRNGRPVGIWRKTDSAGRRKLWVTTDEPILPVRLEIFVRAGAEEITTDYADWARGMEIPDSFFEAPANVTLEEFDYPGFIEAAPLRPIGPVLYPDLLHGTNSP